MELTKEEKELLYGLAHDHYEELYKGDWDAVKEEVSELESAYYSSDMENMKEEMADVILTVLNFAKHYDIDIETEMKLMIDKTILEYEPT